MKNESDNLRLAREYSSFKKRVMSGKHSHWFESLNPNRQYKAFILSKERKNKQKSNNKSFSLNKFLFKIREDRTFMVQKTVLRENSLKKLLS